MTTYATYDGLTISRISLRDKAWHIDGRTKGSFKLDVSTGESVLGWALSKADKLAGRTLYPLIAQDMPSFDAEEETIVQTLTFDALNDVVNLTWNKVSLNTETRKQRRQSKLDEGRQMLADAAWRSGPTWTTWRDLMAIELQGLVSDSIPPKDISWPTPPKPLNII